MDCQLVQQKMRDKVEAPQSDELGKFKQGGNEPPPPSSTASPPSASSSPAHEFSFTISLHQPSTTSTTTVLQDKDKDKDKAKAPPSIAVDLSPADEIFFHGHLLPLHLLSHLPVSPRSSTNSLDSFTLPIRDLLEDRPCKTAPPIHNNREPKERPNSNSNSNSKPKSFSLFGLPRWRKGLEFREKEEKDSQSREKRRKVRLSFDVSHLLKRYARMVRPLLKSLRGRRENSANHLQLRRQPFSFSGNLDGGGGGGGGRGKQVEAVVRGIRRRGEFSAPASMRTSPSNSGLLVGGGGALATPSSSSSVDSTMEELQAAIQAAIAHCKNSIAKSSA